MQEIHGLAFQEVATHFVKPRKSLATLACPDAFEKLIVKKNQNGNEAMDVDQYKTKWKAITVGVWDKEFAEPLLKLAKSGVKYCVNCVFVVCLQNE